MKSSTPIQLKAAFLIMVFAMNTIVGLACSAGIDMGFNSKHHHEEEGTKAVAHVHKDGEKHVHHDESNSQNNDKLNHTEKEDHHNPVSDQNNCCNNKVKDLQQIDKAVPDIVSFVHPLFIAILASYFNISLLHYSDVVKDIKPFVRSYHPPIPDIRIAIRSFQI